jgi:hypothetical protein
MTHPQLTFQVFGGRTAQAHGLGGAPASLHGGVLAVDHVDVLRAMAARDPVDPGEGVFERMMEYRQPVVFS